jgi:hypothetical protein
LHQVEVVVAKASVVEVEVVAVMYDLAQQVLWEVHREEVGVAEVSLVLLQRQQA